MNKAEKKPPFFSVCMVSDDFLPEVTGVAVHLQHITRQLVENGYRVCIITTKQPGQKAFEQWQGVSIYRMPSIKVFGFLCTISASVLS